MDQNLHLLCLSVSFSIMIQYHIEEFCCAVMHDTQNVLYRRSLLMTQLASTIVPIIIICNCYSRFINLSLQYHIM